jgi:hypothetical protein
MDEGDLAVLLFRAAHAEQRPTVELDVAQDPEAEAALRAHAAAEMRRLTHGLALGGEEPAADPDATVRRPGWLFDDFHWEIGEPAEALGRPAVRVTVRPENPTPLIRESFLERIDLVVDVGTGLLLHLVEVHAGRAVRTVAVRAVGAETAVPEPPRGPSVEIGFGPSLRADQIGAAVRTGVLTLGRMAFDASLRRTLHGGYDPDLTEGEFTPTEPVPLDEAPPPVEAVVRLLALARPAGLAGTLRGRFADGRFALPDERRFRLDFSRPGLSFMPLAESYDGERLYRLMPDRLVVERDAPHVHIHMLGFLRRPRAELRRPLTVRDVVDWEGRRAFRVAAARHAFVVDAETGLVLGNEHLELHDLGPAPVEPEHYRLHAPAGVPVVESDGGPLGDAALPPSVRVGLEGAARALGGVAEGIARLLGR